MARRGVIQLQHVAATLRPVRRVILPCQNGYYDSNIKVLLTGVEEVNVLATGKVTDLYWHLAKISELKSTVYRKLVYKTFCWYVCTSGDRCLRWARTRNQSLAPQHLEWKFDADN